MKSEKTFEYIQSGIHALGHTPIYKMHKYFARRPHNVFNHLLNHYSKPGDIVVDVFCGGGVTLIEGLSSERKIIASDINPIATFVSDCETTKIDIKQYKEITAKMRETLTAFTDAYFRTTCRECSSPADVRWFEATYEVLCPFCNEKITLANDDKLQVEGKGINGKYVCKHCKKEFSAVDQKRIGIKLLFVRYRCNKCNKQSTAPVNKEDIEVFESFNNEFAALVESMKLWIPDDKIPDDWDRQQEDCLHRKGFFLFSDLFTKRNLYFNALFLDNVRKQKDHVNSEMYNILLFTCSATMRYINNMTISTSSWMDGRPVAWAKHAFWTPNQFVEVNPIEYYDKRVKAVISGMQYQQKTIKFSKKAESYKELISSNATHIIWTNSSEHLNIPNNSVDLVLTDPPYGENVQYGELCTFWMVWLREDLHLPKEFIDRNNEILVHRKKTENRKDHNSYYKGLLGVFKESYRILKDGCPLIFTFNSKDIKSWYAVLKATMDAGFYLDPDGVVYQESIENYKNTAHTRFSGTFHGDFIYTFRKLSGKRSGLESSIGLNAQEIQNVIVKLAENYVGKKKSCSITELYVQIYERIIPEILQVSSSEKQFSQIYEEITKSDIERTLKSSDKIQLVDGVWKLNPVHFQRNNEVY